MEKRGWICTDPDCYQYSKQMDDVTWNYIQMQEIYNGEFVVSQNVIWLTDYSIDDIESCCNGYYDSLEKIVEIYGFREALHIMAECIFEQLAFDAMNFNIKFPTEEKAKQYIEAWIKIN